MKFRFSLLLLPSVLFAAGPFPAPVVVLPVKAAHGMVVAGHPQATEIGVQVLRDGGNAIDAAVAVSMALGVAEPYASGLGGKLMLLYFDAASGRTYAVDAMDAAPGSLDAAAAVKYPTADRSIGWRAVCVPGLADGLGNAHARWGSKPWADLVRPARELATQGFRVEPKTRTLFEEKFDRLKADPVLGALFLRAGELPEVGDRLPNPALAATLAELEMGGAGAFYHGPIAARIAAASAAGGGSISEADLGAYRSRVAEPVQLDLGDFRLVAAPPPTTGAAMYFPVLKLVADAMNTAEPLRSADNLTRLANVWREVQPTIYREIGDSADARTRFEHLLSPEFLDPIRASTLDPTVERAPVPALENANASTTHFVIVDHAGNIVCATQSLSLHFGAGVVATGTGIIMNDSMSNFAYADATNPNAVAPGRRPRSTICPTIIFENGAPRIAIGLPGGARIPTAMLQVLLDRLVWKRPLAQAIGDTRIHFNPAWRNRGVDAIETEIGLDSTTTAALTAAGWRVNEVEPAGTGLHFGGVNAIEFDPNGGFIGYADPRRTNTAAGY